MNEETENSSVVGNLTTENPVTIDNLSTVCRICLNTCEDLTDIITSGINDKLTEITKLKVEMDDELPKSICFTCNTELDHFFKFMEKVRSADSYLRTLFSSREGKKEKLISEHCDGRKAKILRRGPKKKLRKSKSNKTKMKKSKADEDDLYLIFVPEVTSSESNVNSEILIKQLNCRDENLGLSNFCKTLVSEQFPNCSNSLNCSSNSISDTINSNVNETIRNVGGVCENTNFYKCGECNIFFTQCQDLINHSSEVHNNFEDGDAQNQKTGISEKDMKEEEPFTVEEADKYDSLNATQIPREVFLINLNEFTCKLCLEKIKSESLIDKHVQVHHSKAKVKKYFKKYVCPVCKSSFTDSEREFTEHLHVHKRENADFIRVSSLREPLNEEESEACSAFMSSEDAILLFEAFNKSNKVFKIFNINSCDKCDFVSETHECLVNHYSDIHTENLMQKLTLHCPVCLAEFYDGDCDNNKLKFYDHLKSHKEEGIVFIEVNQNGSLVEKSSEIFTQSKILLELANNCLIVNSSEVWNPDLEFCEFKNSRSSYTCDTCEKVFKKKKVLLKHLKCHRTKEPEADLVCEKCGKKCSGKISYQKHFLKHLNVLEGVGSRRICTICKKTFASRASLNGHLRQHFKDNEMDSSVLGIICEKCGKSFSNNSSLTKHKKIHTGGKENTVLKCEICDRVFSQQSSFDRHKSAHLNPKYLDCEVCKFPFPSALSLQKHSELHKNGTNTHDCKSCKLSFLTKESLSAHQIHAGHYQDRQPLECNVCHEKFFIGKKFSEHIKTHPKYKMGLCTLCGKRLSTPQSLMLHMDRHFESNSILCPHCGKQFFEERNYRRHILTHEGIKPFPCDVKGCEKSFYTLFELNRHKKYHYNKRDFACPYCSKCFHEANHLTIHVRTHTGERPYTCPHCSKGFITRTSCKQHIKLVHRGIGYDMILSSISKKVAVFDAVKKVP